MNADSANLRLAAELLAHPEQTIPASHSAIRDLTAAIRAGDEAAFTIFYQDYSLRLFKYVLVLAKGEEHDAREVLQNVMLKLAKKFEVFDDEHRLWSWLRRLTINTWVDHCRVRKRNKKFVPLDQTAVDLPTYNQTAHVLAASLARLLDQLDPEDSELLRAAYIDDRPLRELADEHAQTYKALESRLARLRHKLRTQLLSVLRHEQF